MLQRALSKIFFFKQSVKNTVKLSYNKISYKEQILKSNGQLVHRLTLL